MKITQELLDLIGNIYDATLDPVAWTENLDRLAKSVGAKAATISTINENDPKLQIWGRSYDVAPSSVRQYWDCFHDDEKEMTRLIGSLPDRQFIQESQLRERMPALAGRETDAQRWKKDILGVDKRVHAGLATGSRNRDVISFSYGINDGTMGLEHQKIATLFLPHLEKAVRISQPLARLQAQYSSLMAALDRLPIGVFFMELDATVMARNAEADRILSLDDGLSISHGGVLTAFSGQEQSYLQRGIRSALKLAAGMGNPEGSVLTVSRRSGADAFLLELVPMTHAGLVGTAAFKGCVAFVIDPENRSAISVEGLRKVYGLTGAEADICRLIVECRGTQEIAEIRNVSIATVRTQMKSVFSKTGAHRKADLVRLAMNVNLPIGS